MGFMPALKKIIAKLPKERQSLFFSATMPPNIVELSERLLYQPVRVNVTPKSSSVKSIDQQLVMVEKGGKVAALLEIVSAPDAFRAIVFTRTKRGANLVAEKLQKNGVKSAAIHGNKSQAARQRALEGFKSGDVHVLVATDLAARGIDVDSVSHVINYDLPNEPESYVHRIGRTGRAGATGVAISFCSSAERSELRAIEDLIGKKIPLAANQPAPSAIDQSETSGSSNSRRSSPRRQPQRSTRTGSSTREFSSARASSTKTRSRTGSQSHARRASR
jgi:ATP-dependent RNA helicase RhlE